MRIKQVRDCPVCSEFLLGHPTLRAPNVLEQALNKSGAWSHTGLNGKKLHSLAMEDRLDPARMIVRLARAEVLAHMRKAAAK